MRFVSVDQSSDEAPLEIAVCAEPVCKSNDVLIQVAYAGVNRPDILQRYGLYPPPKEASPILGLEVAGTVVAVGDQVSQWKIGEQVCALVNGGGYAEFCVAPATQCLPIPKDFSLAEAASLPETFFTVWHNLFQRAKLKPNESVLIHAGASGIGVAAIQIATAMGAQVFTTLSTQEKKDFCESLGAIAINYREEDFVAHIKQLTDNHGVDVILDMVGGDYLQKNISVAAKEGRIVNIAFLQGSKVELDLMPVMLKRLMLTGSTLRVQSDDVKANIAKDLKEFIWPLLEAKKIKPVIDSVFPFEKVMDAHARMESNRHIGKIILKLN